MARNPGQKIKILYLMKIMYEQTDDIHGLTLQQIAEELEKYGIRAERKALYDDIETLCDFGMDIEKRKEKNVTYHVMSRDFELPELKLLVDAVQSSKFITHKKSTELIRKLSSFSSKYQANALSRQVYVSNRIKTMNESIYYTVDYIHEAISDNVQITFNYFEWTPKREKQLRRNGKTYQVSPWALTWDDENYYLVAYDTEHKEIRHYRVDKMVNIALTQDVRDGKEVFADFDMAVYSKKTFGMFAGEETRVTLRCKNNLAGVIIDRFGQDTTFFTADDEHFDINVKVAVSPMFLSWVMNFGSDMKVLSPASVQEKIKALAKEVLEQY